MITNSYNRENSEPWNCRSTFDSTRAQSVVASEIAVQSLRIPTESAISDAERRVRLTARRFENLRSQSAERSGELLGRESAHSTQAHRRYRGSAFLTTKSLYLTHTIIRQDVSCKSAHTADVTVHPSTALASIATQDQDCIAELVHA